MKRQELETETFRRKLLINLLSIVGNTSFCIYPGSPAEV